MRSADCLRECRQLATRSIVSRRRESQSAWRWELTASASRANFFRRAHYWIARRKRRAVACERRPQGGCEASADGITAARPSRAQWAGARIHSRSVIGNRAALWPGAGADRLSPGSQRSAEGRGKLGRHCIRRPIARWTCRRTTGFGSDVACRGDVANPEPLAGWRAYHSASSQRKC